MDNIAEEGCLDLYSYSLFETKSGNHILFLILSKFHIFRDVVSTSMSFSVLTLFFLVISHFSLCIWDILRQPGHLIRQK